jgi:septum formation protein
MRRRIRIVLASSSPRRKQLLEQLGLHFEAVEPGEVEDTLGIPKELVVENALAKVRKVVEQRKTGLVVAADTVVAVSGRVLGKPKDSVEAVEMLRTLRGSIHEVITGLAVIDAASGRVKTEVVETSVRMKQLSEDEIEAYIATGEPFGKAGGYAIQGIGALLVEEIHGCFYNVVGLPLSRLYDLLKMFGVRVIGDNARARRHLATHDFEGFTTGSLILLNMFLDAVRARIGVRTPPTS